MSDKEFETITAEDIRSISTLQDVTLMIVDRALLEGHNPSAIAAALLSTSMKLYRTILTPEDYVAMTEAIVAMRDQITPFPQPDSEQSIRQPHSTTLQ